MDLDNGWFFHGMDLLLVFQKNWNKVFTRNWIYCGLSGGFVEKSVRYCCSSLLYTRAEMKGLVK
jgi:hypothetical protein